MRHLQEIEVNGVILHQTEPPETIADEVSARTTLPSRSDQQLIQIAIVKKAHEMEMTLVDMLDQAVRSAPAPAGTGTIIDKRA